MINKNFILCGLLFLIILGGIFLRFYKLDKESFWYDEVFALRMSSGPIVDLIVGRRWDPANPPLYYIFLNSFLNIVGGQFSQDEAVPRFLSAIFGSLGIILFFLLSNEILREKSQSFFSTILFSLSVFLIQYSQTARSYALQALLVTLLYFSLFKIFQYKDKVFHFFLFVIAGTLGAYCHYTLILLLAIIFCSFLILKIIDRYLLASFLLIFLLFSPWFINFFLPVLASPKIRKAYNLIGNGRASVSFYHLVDRLLNYFLSTLHINKYIFFFLWFLAIFFTLKKRPSQFLRFIAFHLLIISSLLIFTPLGRLIYNDYYYLFIAPLLFIWLGYFSSYISKLRWVILVIWLLISVRVISDYYRLPHIPQFREVADYLKKEMEEKDQVYIRGCDVNYVLSYYWRLDNMMFPWSCYPRDFPGFDNLDFLVKRKEDNFKTSSMSLAKGFYGLEVYERKVD